MSQNILQGGPFNITEDNLRKLLSQGNIYQINKKSHLTNIIQQIQTGNNKLYKQFINVIIQLLKQPNQKKQTKQILYDHITTLVVTANHLLINDLNNDLFRIIPQLYSQKDTLLTDYVTLWKHMYNGKKDRQDFPNVAKTLQKIPTPQSMKVTGKLAKFFSQFNKNLQNAKQKKVQFFQDFDDSSVSQSFIDESRMTQIVYMDIMELKAIRQKVQTQPLTEQNCTEYLIKMKTFLNLKSTSLSGDLLNEFNKQKIWAKHFIDHHQEYLNRNNTNQSINKTNMLLHISLSKDEQSIQLPPTSFQKNKNKISIRREQTFGYIEQNNNGSKKRLQSEINNFTINEVPIDQSRYTQRTSKNMLPVFNNSIGERVYGGEDHIVEKSQQLSIMKEKYDNRNTNIYDNNQQYILSENYQRMQLQPADKRINTIQQVSRPQPQDTLPLQQSTLNNISIPVQLATPMTMMLKHPASSTKTNQFPNIKYNNKMENIQYSNSKKDFSSSNNPFANSKTNYNPFPQSNIKTPYEIYKQNKEVIDIHSPIRNKMTEDDLDSDNIGEDLIVKPHYQKNLAFSSAQIYGIQNNNNAATQYAKTQLNFYPPQQNVTIYAKSHQKMFSQQLSPRSNAYGDSRSSKKRLSQLTSQKKQRKNNALREQTLNWPQEYAFRPYSVHFRKDLQNFNNFKRNCLQQKFPVYVSEELVISCKLRKVKQSRVQVEIVYENQCRQQLSMRILYKIPKSFKIQKVTKIHRKFNLVNIETHKFNLKVAEFPLQMCFLQLSYGIGQQQDESIIPSAHIPLPITLRNFIQTLASSRQEWIKTYKKLTTQSSQQPYIIEKTFEINRDVVEPSSLQDILGREFMNIGASEGYSVEELGCVCHYREINNLMFLLRIAIRVDHIATLSIITEHQLTNNQKDFLNYFMEILLTILAKYPI